ncbi:unnamed protein product [Ambrosiozyma monospora]|uniref:Unnamed protein product n=1 Tax=Ambrosiozyma monospora TaxID=43982 RepID=A0ACB5SVW8_AMBMO|nr:unnamed protein product [Ambrosiozyma monospora]
MVFQVNVPVGKAAKPNETAPRRYYKVKDGALSRPIGMKCETVWEYFNECAQMHGLNSKCQGWRDLIDIHFEKKMVKKYIDGKTVEVEKEWMYYEKSDYKYVTFGELRDLCVTYGKGLSKIGMKPREDRLHIFASTSAKWMRSFLAAQSQSIAVVTAYDSLGEDGLTHSLVQTGSAAIFLDNELLGKLVNPLKKATNVRYIIYSEKIDPNDKRAEGRLSKNAQDGIDKIKAVRPDIKLYSYDEVIELGKAADKEIEIVPPKAEDLCTIMYTSGSTGPPKGVVLSHKNVVAGVGGISIVIDHKIVTKKDRVICFLPLAHIFELVFELIGFFWGGVNGYASVKTLTDASCKNCEGDMKAFQPTIMVGVGAVWESIRKGILAQINKLPPTSQKVFWAAYSAKSTLKRFHVPILPSVIDSLVFKKIKAATGGHLRYMLNGGSPLSIETQKFISEAIGAPLLIGYGLTETTANTCVLDPEHFEYGCAGTLVGSVTVKLIDVPDAGYYAKNNQGEVLIKGLSVMSEYYKNEGETSNAFNYEQGWFSTGDIGEWLPNGHLKLIDRKKNLVKTQNGEYIALEKLESIYRSNSAVSNICCYADETKVKPIAIVVPNEPVVKKIAVQLGLADSIDNAHISDLINDKKLCSYITKDLVKTGKEHGLAGIELILGVVILDDEWTPENGYVTSAQKLQRKKILASVQDRVDALYAANS